MMVLSELLLLKEDSDAALDWIMGIVAEPEEGKLYKGVIVKIMDFGAFVRFLGANEGLVHISEVKNERIASVSDFYKEGDELWVKCIGLIIVEKLNYLRKE